MYQFFCRFDPGRRAAGVAELLPKIHVVHPAVEKIAVGHLDLPDVDVRAAQRQFHPLVGLAEHLGFLGPPALADVAEDQDDAGDSPAFVEDGGAAVVDRHLAAVPGQERRVVGQPDHRAQAEHLGRGILDRLPGLLVDDVEHLGQRPPDRLRSRPAGQRFGRWVQEGHTSLGVGGDDRVADAGQRHRVAALAGGNTAA